MTDVCSVRTAICASQQDLNSNSTSPSITPRAEEEEAPTNVESPRESVQPPKERPEDSRAPEKRGFLSRLFKRS
jgi:hypothetical protein